MPISSIKILRPMMHHDLEVFQQSTRKLMDNIHKIILAKLTNPCQENWWNISDIQGMNLVDNWTCLVWRYCKPSRSQKCLNANWKKKWVDTRFCSIFSNLVIIFLWNMVLTYAPNCLCTGSTWILHSQMNSR